MFELNVDRHDRRRQGHYWRSLSHRLRADCEARVAHHSDCSTEQGPQQQQQQQQQQPQQPQRRLRRRLRRRTRPQQSSRSTGRYFSRRTNTS